MFLIVIYHLIMINFYTTTGIWHKTVNYTNIKNKFN